jgi:hypothetical protein
MQPSIYKLKDVSDSVDIKSVMKPRYKIMNGIYARVKDGFLIIVGSSSLKNFDINFLIKMFAEKLKDQKKKPEFDTAVFWYAV